MGRWAGASGTYSTELERVDDELVKVRVAVERLREQLELELERDKTDKHETVISPFVAAIHYEYYDADLKEWKVEDEPVNETGSTAWKKPVRIHLMFERGTLKSEKVINLPIKRSGASTP